MFAALFYGAFLSWSENTISPEQINDKVLVDNTLSKVSSDPLVAEFTITKSLEEETKLKTSNLSVLTQPAMGHDEVLTNQIVEEPEFHSANTQLHADESTLNTLNLKWSFLSADFSVDKMEEKPFTPVLALPNLSKWAVNAGGFVGANLYSDQFLPSHIRLSNDNETTYDIEADLPAEVLSFNTYGFYLGAEKAIGDKWYLIGNLSFQQISGEQPYTVDVEKEKEVEHIVYMPVDQNGQTTVQPVTVTNNAIFNYSTEAKYHYQYQQVQLGIGVGYTIQRYQNWSMSSNFLINAGYNYSSINRIELDHTEFDLDPFSSVVYSPQLGFALERNISRSSSLMLQPTVGYHFYDQSSNSIQSTFMNFAFGFKHRL